MTTKASMTPGSPARSAPSSVITGMRLMFLGAAIGLAGVIALVADRSSLREAISDANAGSTAARIDSMLDTAVITGVIFGLFFVALYSVLAIQVGQGRNWARIVTWIFAAIGVVLALMINTQTQAASGKVVMVVAGVVDLAIVIVLALKSSNSYFRKRSAGAPLAA